MKNTYLFYAFIVVSFSVITAQAQDCLTSPIISCPATYFGCPGDDISPAAIGSATAVAGDANCLQPIISFTDTLMLDDPCNGVRKIKRIWKADYPNNDNPWLFAECSQIIYLMDDEAPVISACPANITVSSDASCNAVATWIAPTASDDCGIAAISSSRNSGSLFTVGVTTVTYTASDNCGKISQCFFTVTVTENCCEESPIITCPANITICPGQSTAPNATGTATAAYQTTSNCPAPTITFTDQISGSGCNETITRTWRAVNPSKTDEFSTCIQIISIRDAELPVFFNCPSDITVNSNPNCVANVNWTPPNGTDNCGIQSLSSSITPGSLFQIGTTPVTYTIVDNCGNQATCAFNVTVIEACCQQTPIITCPGDVTICPNSSADPNITGGATATYQNPTNCRTPLITYSDSTTGSGCDAVIVRTWRAANPDDATLFVECVQQIRFVDNTPPTFLNCPSNLSVNTNANCIANVNWTPPTATDNCGIASMTSSHLPGSVFPSGSTIVTYSVTDRCGNMASCSFTITVIEKCCVDIPIINCPPDITSCPGSSIDPINTGVATAQYPNPSDCEAPIITFTDVTTGSGCDIRITRTWTATNPRDANLNSSCTQLIRLLDDSLPTISNCPANITIESDANCTAQPNWAAPTATDACGMASLVASHMPNSPFAAGITLVTYTATDLCNNTSTCSFTVNVIANCCDEAPVIICPSDFVGCVSSSVDPSITGQASYSANPSCITEISYTDEVNTGNGCTNDKIIKRTWVAINQASLSDTCIQMIMLRDTVSPTITNCPSNVTLAGPQAYSWTTPTFNDNCHAILSSNIPNGSGFFIGITEVFLTATDDCGNTASCSFTVTVTPPVGTGIVINCPERVTIDCGDTGKSIPQPTASSDCEDCDRGNIPGFVYMGEYNGHKYYCSDGKLTWPEAKAHCEANGGHLAIINDLKENFFLVSRLRADAAYIGLSDSEKEGTFKWVDGSPVTTTNWYPQQPNDFKGQQDYVELLKNGQWNDQYNDKPLEYIMEIGCLDIVQISGPTSTADISSSATVAFEVTDACGNRDTCSYEIIINNEVSLTCPTDIVLSTEGDYAVAYWDTPNYETCCSDCRTGREIPGYIYMGHKNGSHYYCSKSNYTWHEANLQARQNGGYLAIISTDEENHYLASKLGNQIAFIGVSDHKKEGEFRDVDGKIQSYFNWKTGQPNNYKENQHYVEMDATGGWNDNDAIFKREYIMEISDCGHIKQTAGHASGGLFPVGTTHVSFEAKDDCGNITTCSFNVKVNKKSSDSGDYCSSYGQNSDKAYIRQVQIEHYLFKSGNNGGYKYINSPCVDVARGSRMNVYVTPGYTNTAYWSYWRLFIDLNHDNDFDDEGEYLGRGRTYNGLRGDLPIPSTAKLGPTRFRVVMSLNDYPTSSCGMNKYGETEDYCINIVAGHGINGNTLKNNVITAGPITLAEIGENVSMIISPNPAAGATIIRSNAAISNVSIYNQQGQKVLDQKYLGVNQEEKLELSDLPAGLYLIQLSTANGESEIGKLIVH